jgi:hypothetical protein
MGSKKGISGEEVQYNAEISRRVEFFRRVKGIQHGDLAEAAGVKPSRFTGYESGAVRWPVFRLRLIADFFQVSIGLIVPKNSDYLKNPCETREDA